MVAATSVAAGTLNFLKDAPIGSFKTADIEMLKQAVQAMLDDGDTGAAREWKNAETGNSGRVENRASFKAADGRPCKRLHVTTRTPTAEQQVVYLVCRDEDGRWKLDETAKPRGSDSALG
jgi:surface antigen